MQILVGFIITVCLLATFHNAREIPDREIELNIGSASPVITEQNVSSLAQLQSRSVVKQNFDYSCGSAALATLLDYYLGEELTERQVIQGLMEYGDSRKIAERRAFSFLDMKKFVNKLGYQGIGYKAELKDLLEINKPCIVPITFFGYRHFTVLKGFYNGHIFLADPFRGNTSYTVAEFKKMWYENVIFVVDTNGTTINALKLTDADMRIIDEDSVLDLISEYGPYFPPIDERNFYFKLPDDYQVYRK